MIVPVFRTAVSGAVLVLALAGWSVSATAQTETPAAGAETAGEAEDRVVAEVNGEPIYESEVLETVQNLPPQVRQMPQQMLLPLVADQIATGRLVAEQAYADGIDESEAVQERLAEAERRIVQEVWLDQQIEARTTDEAVQQAYDEYVAANPPQEEVRARHILVETEEEAREIITQLQEGGDFAQLANERSQDPGASNGGDLGYFTREQMVQPFAEAAFSIEPGQVSEEPVETQFGWHVIKVEDKRMSEAPAIDEIRPQIEQTLQRQIVQDIVADLRADAEITIYGPDGEPLPDPAAPAGAAPAAPEQPSSAEPPAEGESTSQ